MKSAVLLLALAGACSAAMFEYEAVFTRNTGEQIVREGQSSTYIGVSDRLGNSTLVRAQSHPTGEFFASIDWFLWTTEDGPETFTGRARALDTWTFRSDELPDGSPITVLIWYGLSLWGDMIPADDTVPRPCYGLSGSIRSTLLGVNENFSCGNPIGVDGATVLRSFVGSSIVLDAEVEATATSPINDPRGWSVGISRVVISHAFLTNGVYAVSESGYTYTPTPEPSAILLTAPALLALMAAKRWRQRA